MDRRTFMSWVGLGFVASSLPVAIAACSSSDTATSEATSSPAAEDAPPPPPADATPAAREDGFVEVGTLADLDANGSILDKNFKPEALVVFRDPTNSETIIALNAVCPHAQCKTDWNSDEKLLVCPCHDSKFKADGSVESGPAKAPLKPYELKLEGDLILVKA